MHYHRQSVLLLLGTFVRIDSTRFEDTIITIHITVVVMLLNPLITHVPYIQDVEFCSLFESAALSERSTQLELVLFFCLKY